MSHGAPDYYDRSIIQGYDGSNHKTIKVDADGRMIAAIVGDHSGDQIQLAVDASGKMYAKIYGHDGIANRQIKTDDSGEMLARIRGNYAGNPMPVTLDSDGKMIAHMQGRYNDNPLDLSVDVGGNIIAIMQGNYEGANKSVAVDTDGRMQAQIQANAALTSQPEIMINTYDTSDIDELINAYSGQTDKLRLYGEHSVGIYPDNSGWYGCQFNKTIGYWTDFYYIYVAIYSDRPNRPMQIRLMKDENNYWYWNYTSVKDWRLLKVAWQSPDGMVGTCTASTITDLRILQEDENWIDTFYINRIWGSFDSNMDNLIKTLDVNEFGGLTVHLAAMYGSMSKVLQSDSDGSLVTKMTGEYAGESKNIAVDNSGRMKAYMDVSGGLIPIPIVENTFETPGDVTDSLNVSLESVGYDRLYGSVTLKVTNTIDANSWIELEYVAPHWIPYWYYYFAIHNWTEGLTFNIWFMKTAVDYFAYQFTPDKTWQLLKCDINNPDSVVGSPTWETVTTCRIICPHHAAKNEYIINRIWASFDPDMGNTIKTLHVNEYGHITTDLCAQFAGTVKMLQAESDGRLKTHNT